jgi:uncharacterized NAD(P)/FAD-binding protein YdhS
MTTTLKPVDVVIIGGGWTGLTMARELTAAPRSPFSCSNAAFMHPRNSGLGWTKSIIPFDSG